MEEDFLFARERKPAFRDIYHRFGGRWLRRLKLGYTLQSFVRAPEEIFDPRLLVTYDE